MEGFSTRCAAPSDAGVIAGHRRRMFHDMGHTDAAELDQVEAKFTHWVKPRLGRGEYRGWLITETGGGVIAGAGLWLVDWPPGPGDLTMRRGYIFNVYTVPEFRRRGLARKLMTLILDECRRMGIRTVSLHASPDGVALYGSLGFRQTNEMRLQFPPAVQGLEKQ